MSSRIGNLHITTTASNAVIQIGDTCRVDSNARVIAVQRQREFFYGEEAPFSNYEIFSTPPAPPRHLLDHCLCQPSINTVGSLRLVGLANSSVLHVGNSEHIRMVSRVKHIRHFHGNQEFL
ncbi:spore germination protein GerPE [Jeotgalibacillus proteolyticus]|uniref:Spore germination protein GerPE n=1 Tax=Jeotgalibacillus proteolyticus TaxID=2082395 RepID=A0A2S5GH41_9BACL|nr:spore germination protein GerPE [Jeotgalibacillus proteolyticus]PPA72372.1 spore germination protein GerPE [Jeotgalibacillus proteolyticus]